MLGNNSVLILTYFYSQIKAPLVKSDDKKEDQFLEDDKKDTELDSRDDKNQPGNLPLPYLNNNVRQKPSSASNNAAERPAEDPGDNLPAPVLHPPGEEK